MAGTLSDSPLSLAQGMMFLIKANKQMKQKNLDHLVFSREQAGGSIQLLSVQSWAGKQKDIGHLVDY